MKLIRRLLYITAGITAGMLLKRYLIENQNKTEPAKAPAPSGAEASQEPEEDLIPVVEIIQTDPHEDAKPSAGGNT